MTVTPKGLPGGEDCCTPWAKIMQRLRELETGLSQRVKKVKVNGQTIYPVNDGEIVLPDYPEGGGAVQTVSVGGTKYTPDDEGDVDLPAYPPDVSADVDALETEVGSLDDRMESVEDDVGNLDTAVTGLGTRMTDAENGIDDLEGRMDAAEDDIIALEDALPDKANMHIDIIDPGLLTEGEVGDLWYNKVDDKLWKCASVTEFDYHWTEVGGGSGGSVELPFDYWIAPGDPQWDGITTLTHNGEAKTLAEFASYITSIQDDSWKLIRIVFTAPRYDGMAKSFEFQPKNTTFDPASSTEMYFISTSPDAYLANGTPCLLKWNVYRILNLRTASPRWAIDSDVTVRGALETLNTIAFNAGAQAAGASYNFGSYQDNIFSLQLDNELYDAIKAGDISLDWDGGNLKATVINPVTFTASQWFVKNRALYYTGRILVSNKSTNTVKQPVYYLE